MYDNVVTSVRTSDVDTDDFPIKIGLHQGLTLSPYLFALAAGGNIAGGGDSDRNHLLVARSGTLVD